MQNKLSQVIKQVTIMSNTAVHFVACCPHGICFKRNFKTFFHGSLEFYKVCFSSVRNLHVKFASELGGIIKPFLIILHLHEYITSERSLFSVVWLQIIPSTTCHSSILVCKSNRVSYN